MSSFWSIYLRTQLNVYYTIYSCYTTNHYQMCTKSGEMKLCDWLSTATILKAELCSDFPDCLGLFFRMASCLYVYIFEHFNIFLVRKYIICHTTSNNHFLYILTFSKVYSMCCVWSTLRVCRQRSLPHLFVG